MSTIENRACLAEKVCHVCAYSANSLSEFGALELMHYQYFSFHNQGIAEKEIVISDINS